MFVCFTTSPDCLLSGASGTGRRTDVQSGAILDAEVPDSIIFWRCCMLREGIVVIEERSSLECPTQVESVLCLFCRFPSNPFGCCLRLSVRRSGHSPLHPFFDWHIFLITSLHHPSYNETKISESHYWLPP